MTNDPPRAACGGRKATGAGKAPGVSDTTRTEATPDPRARVASTAALRGDGVDVALGEAVSGAGSVASATRRPLGAVVDLGS